MGPQRLFLVHQPVGYMSVLNLFQHVVVVAAVEADSVEGMHLLGAFQIDWIAE